MKVLFAGFDIIPGWKHYALLQAQCPDRLVLLNGEVNIEQWCPGSFCRGLILDQTSQLQFQCFVVE